MRMTCKFQALEPSKTVCTDEEKRACAESLTFSQNSWCKYPTAGHKPILKVGTHEAAEAQENCQTLRLALAISYALAISSEGTALLWLVQQW